MIRQLSISSFPILATMDNATFTLKDDQTSLTLLAKNRKGHIYECHIDNFIICQIPKAILNEGGCKDTIIEFVNANRHEYNYSQETDTFIVTINWLPTKGKIVLSLTRSEGETDASSNLIAQVTEILDSRDDYEIIHEHEYPTWNTLQEFMALPDFKYFEAADNQERFMCIPPDLKPPPDKPTHFKWGDRYIRTKNHWIHNHVDEKDANGNKHNGTIGVYWNKRQQRSQLHDRELQSNSEHLDNECKDNKKPYPLYYEFIKSATDHVPQWACLSYWVVAYIKKYIAGWMIVNLKWIAMRSLNITILVDSKRNKTMITIKRTKYMTVNNPEDLVMYWPIVSNCTIDDMRI